MAQAHQLSDALQMARLTTSGVDRDDCAQIGLPGNAVLRGNPAGLFLIRFAPRRLAFLRRLGGLCGRGRGLGSWHSARMALLIIIALLIAIAETMIAASRVERLAAWLLAPYLLWAAYATTINIGVVAMN
jgi:hypothetical protein